MLNAEQKRAVETVEGRVLVLAGPGSGKTRVIVHRIAHLVQKCHANPESILGLTFTNKAAGEMRHRLDALIGPSAQKVMLCTFHSFCMQVLRKEIQILGYTRNFSLYDDRDMRRLVAQTAREMLGHEGVLPSLEPTLAALSQAGQKAFHSEEEDADFHWHDTFSKDIYSRLKTTLKAYNAVNFDSLITLAIELFEKHPGILSRYQERCRYLMIDEFQDTNPAQMRLAELLAGKYQNLCVVGDDDQSVYGWRGADIQNILHFRADSKITLEQNYRSTPQILSAASALIGHNQNRHPKNLKSKKADAEPISVFNAETDAEEAAAIVQRLLYYRETKNLRWRDMAILYRSNALSRQFEMALMQAPWQKEGHWVRGIPYEIYGGLEFSERSEIKDLFAYLRLIANPLDSEALLRIINVPRRGISDAILSQVTEHNRSAGIPLINALEQIAGGQLPIGNARAQNAVRSFLSLIEKYRKSFQNNFADSLTNLIEETGYKRAIEEEVKSEKMREFKWENVQECINAIAEFERADAGSLQDFISTYQLSGSEPETAKRMSDDKVKLMTLHSAKGLEFPACFIVGLEDHLLPHEKSVKDTGIEEERRLFYVGMTRAERFLTLSMARTRMRSGKYFPTNPSRFLFEIPKDLLKATTPKSL